MAWAVDKDDLEKFVQVNFPAAATAEFDETIVARALDVSISRVDSRLMRNGYSVSGIQADTTTNGYKFLNNLVLKLSAVEVLLWLKTNTPQAENINITELSEKCEADIALITTDPVKVLGDISLPDAAPQSKTTEIIAANTDDPDLRPSPVFTRDDIIY